MRLLPLGAAPPKLTPPTRAIFAFRDKLLVGKVGVWELGVGKIVTQLLPPSTSRLSVQQGFPNPQSKIQNPKSKMA
jgi:hypothetical protein